MRTEKYEDDDLWGLSEPLRFPVDHKVWENIEHLPIVTPSPATDRDYSDLLILRTRNSALREIEGIIATRPYDFAAVSTSIRPEAWRLLYYRGLYVMESLTTRKFHALAALRRRCSPIIDEDDPPVEWLGTDLCPQAIAEDLELTLRHLGPGPANAAWVALSLAQSTDLTTAEVLKCPWWQPEWIRSFTAKVMFIP